MMLVPSIALLSTISRQIRLLRTTTLDLVSQYQEACKEDSDRIIGHNIIGYDLPVIRKLYPWFGNPAHVVDTLLLADFTIGHD